MKSDEIHVHPHRSVPDWYELQKRNLLFNEIAPDQEVIQRLTHTNWTIDLSKAHQNLKTKLWSHNTSDKKFDFFIMTDIELSKLPLEMFFKIVQHKYQHSKYGGYIALLSYYLTSNTTYSDLGASYKYNINQVCSQYLEFVNNIENKSMVYDQPIDLLDDKGKLLEGSNFIFVHPNIRFWLWK
jgi:hypothetical protein